MADDLAWETLESEIAYSCPGFDVRTQTVRLPDGTETDFDYVDEPESVVVLPFAEDGSVVVIEEWRQPVDRTNFGVPAGGIEPGDDDPEAAARRELAEETGYESTEFEFLATVEPTNGVSNAVFHYFVAHDCTPTARQNLDHNESIRVGTTDFDRLREDAVAGELQDGRTALAVLYYVLQDAETTEREQ